MNMEDLALQVEAYIEDLYQKRHGDKWGKIQVQVESLMDKEGTRRFGFQDEVHQHLRRGDTVVMKVNAVNSRWAQAPQQPELPEEMLERIRSMLRFGLNDRVLCYCGPRWLSGHVVGTAVMDEALLPYVVKTDPLPGLPAKNISVPSDKDECCTQEVCFDPATELELVRCAASPYTASKEPKLRFALGDKVVCRIRNSPVDGLENWVPGVISKIWPNIGEATWDLGELSGKFPDVVPYKIDLASGRWVYCHRDDHTLIRREGLQPVTRVKGISKRMELVKEADGSTFRVDHVTERRKRVREEVDYHD